MILLHTSDWHLGRNLCGIPLLEDQADALEQFIAAVKDIRPDLVLIVGDLFEHSSPPPEAVHLMDDVLSRLILECKVRVVLTPGQHDSASRLAFGSWLMGKRGLHVVTTLEQALSPIMLEDADGPIHLNVIPFLEPSIVARQFRTAKIAGFGQAGTAILDHLTRFRRLRRKAVRGVVSGYFHLEGGLTCGVERPLGPVDDPRVQLATMEGISYAALGYLHTPQRLGPHGEFCYAGSLLAYSFEEAEQTKGFQKAVIGADGVAHVETIPIKPRRHLHRFVGDLKSLLAGPSVPVLRQDLVMLKLVGDLGPLSAQAMESLRRQYPNLMRVERDWTGPEHTPTGSDTLELFRRFHQEVVGAPLDGDSETLLREVLGPRSGRVPH